MRARFIDVPLQVRRAANYIRGRIEWRAKKLDATVLSGRELLDFSGGWTCLAARLALPC
jgi:hypothetical protein